MKNEIRLIGAALPRTGTMSLKNAFQILEFGESYHMHELFLNPDHVNSWKTLQADKTVNLKKVLAGYTATLDTPACLYWREIKDLYPNAKVLLVRRNPEQWYESVKSTIYKVISQCEKFQGSQLDLVESIFFKGFFEGRFLEKEFAIQKYYKYCDEVKNVIPENELLEYEISEGWKPLCRFLDIDIPKIEFPKINSRKEFQQRIET